MKKIVVFLVLIILIAITLLLFLSFKGYQILKQKGLSIATFQEEYKKGENPKIKIKNNSNERICFSSCYPYYLEKNNGSPLESYQYSVCPHPDIAEICMGSGETKAFEILLDKMKVQEGYHRIAVPACISCVLQGNFRQDKFFYSNKFMIK